MNISSYFENTDALYDGLENLFESDCDEIRLIASTFIRDRFQADLDNYLKTEIVYPRFGYTTAQIINNEDEYRDYLQKDFDEQMAVWLKNG